MFEIKALAGKDLDANMVIGGTYDLKERLVIRIRIGDEESVISVENFCYLAGRYLQGGIFGWQSKENPNSPPMPEYVKETIKGLVQCL
ncbi:MAG: hypothetical protein WC022_02560 [Parcubacteria group bacterium]